MKILVFGAGPLGCFYAHLFNLAKWNVTLLARGHRYEFIKTNGVVLQNGFNGQRESLHVKVIDELRMEDEYDLAIVFVRKSKLESVLSVLAKNRGIKNILFMGNNALGFERYFHYLPRSKVLFGFPGVGAGIVEDVVTYVDREKERGKRRPIILGEVDGEIKERTRAIRSLFESSGISVTMTQTIEGWLKYHVAMISPLVNALYKYDCDNYALANDKETLRVMIRAAKEGGRVLEALGYKKREPFQFNLFYWLPEILNVMAIRGILNSAFAEVGFALHARAARDEMRELAMDFRSLSKKTTIETPNIDSLRMFVD